MLVLENLQRARLPDALRADRPVDVILAQGHAAAGRLQSLWIDPDLERRRHEVEVGIVPPVRVLVAPDVELRSNHLPYKDGAVIFATGVHPDYVKEYEEKGVIPAPLETDCVRSVEEPAFCVTSFPLRTYGHFLLEMMPKVLLALMLRRAGWQARIVFPSDAGPATDIVRRLCPAESLLLYESAKERLRLRVSLHPSLMLRGQMHDVFVALIRALVMQVTFAADAPEPAGGRVFLSRRNWRGGYRTLTNESELSEVAFAYGFRVVHPQDLNWTEQIALFAGASHVISAYNSALHGALFSPRGTRIISFGWVNNLQDGIAASLGHRIGYLAPSKGAISRYDPLAPAPQNYEVSARELRSRLQSLS